MIALITAFVQLTLAILSQIFSEIGAAAKERRAVDGSNANFQLMLAKAMKKIGQAKDTNTRKEDDQVDDELKKFKDQPKP